MPLKGKRCPKCGSINFRKVGIMPFTLGINYQCNDCSHKFSTYTKYPIPKKPEQQINKNREKDEKPEKSFKLVFQNCPACGARAYYVGFTIVECSNPSCIHFFSKEKNGQEFDEYDYSGNGD